MPLDRESVRYDLLRAEFDFATGALGERVDTLYDSRTAGGSVSFPRVSPDGRYLMYTRADYGTFPVWHAEADLAVMDLHDGSEVDASALNSDEAESLPCVVVVGALGGVREPPRGRPLHASVSGLRVARRRVRQTFSVAAAQSRPKCVASEIV